MVPDEEELKKQRQSKALGAAFLAHQVSQLEQSVDTLAFSRDSRLYSRGGGGNRGSRGPGRGGRGGANRGGTRGGSPAANSAGGRSRERQTRVVDASVLVHALPVLKQWIREDKYKLVVPLSALSTLDVLKKAPQPLHGLAREATRFLEGQLAIAHQIQSAFSPENAEARIRLRAQTAKEEASWAEVQELFTVPKDWTVELPEGVGLPLDEDGEAPLPLPLPTADDIPRHLRGALQCALYFARPTPIGPPIADPAAPVPTVLFKSSIPTLPPLAAELAKLVRKANDSASPASPRKASAAGAPPDYLAISSGDALAYWLDTFFPSASSSAYQEVSPLQVEAASAWLKQQAANRQTSSSAPARQARADPASGAQKGDQARGKAPRRTNEKEGSAPTGLGGRTLFSAT